MAKPKKSRTYVVAIESDQHAGSTVAVCPPTISLDDGGNYLASKLQRWLYAKRQAFWQRVGEVRAQHDAFLLEAFNGDWTDGDHHQTTQILSGNPVAQAACVNELMKTPLSLDPDALLFIRGTEAHVGKSACFEERIASGLKKDKRPVLMDEETGNASHWRRKIVVGGVLFDFAHHGKMGTMPWTRPNATMNHAAAIFYEHAKNGERHPDFAIRSHYHQFFDTGSAHPVRVIQTPAWQAHTAFTHRIDTTGKIADFGGIIVVVRDGYADVQPVLYKPDPSPTITL